MSKIQEMMARKAAERAASNPTTTTVTTPATTVTAAAPVAEVIVTPVAAVTETAPAAAPAAEPAKTRKPRTPKPAATAAPAVVEATPNVEAPATTELAVREDAPVAISTATPIGMIAGQIQTSDLRLPRLQHVQSVGDLSAQFQAGTITFDGEAVLAKPDASNPMKFSEEVLMIPIRAARVLRENFKWNDPKTKDKMPREFPSEEAVVAAGGVVDYDQGEGHFRPALNLLCAFVKEVGDVSDELAPYFVDVDEEAGIALAVCTVRFANSAFTRAGKTIITDSARALRTEKFGLLAAYYSYRLERFQTPGGDWVWGPSVRLLRERTEMSTRELLASIYS